MFDLEAPTDQLPSSHEMFPSLFQLVAKRVVDAKMVLRLVFVSSVREMCVCAFV